MTDAISRTRWSTGLDATLVEGRSGQSGIYCPWEARAERHERRALFWAAMVAPAKRRVGLIGRLDYLKISGSA